MYEILESKEDLGFGSWELQRMDKGLEFGAGAGTQDSQNDNLSENGGQKEFPSSANEHRSPQNGVMERHGTKKRAEEKTKDPWTVQDVLQIC